MTSLVTVQIFVLYLNNGKSMNHEYNQRTKDSKD